nr:PREDICTED: rho GTPase-activating protein 190 isoform X3 [Bemisia tabaci]
MARKNDASKWFNVAVVGLSGTEKDKGAVGIGKSCLCNRFIRSLADDYSVDHISVLSQSDFSGRVVNNDHFLYWGEVSKATEEGAEIQFQVIEQTEFIDDASFQPFKGGKMEPYIKRCAAVKLTSAEKLMYICKNQLGIEKEYEQKVLPDGRISIDGFLCLFDVSEVPSRSIEKQVEFSAGILNNLIKTKKPIVLVTTKNDDANELFVKEAERLVNRKEYKGAIPMVETSAHENINVDMAFIALAQLVDRIKGRSKILPYHEAARSRKEQLDLTADAFAALIRSQITDYRSLWSTTAKKLAKHEIYIRYLDLFGVGSAQSVFRRHLKKLKDEYLAKRVQGYLEMLPDILQELVPEISSFRDVDWPSVQQHIKEHPDFGHYFYNPPDDMPWTECDLEDDEGQEERRIPYDVLETGEAETVFKNHASALQQEQKRLEWKKQFKELLEDTGYVTPGKPISDVRVLLMGQECYHALTEEEIQYIYDKHQKEIIEKAKHNFQELLLEHADLFHHVKSIAPSGARMQEYVKELTDSLKEDSRYKALDRLDQDRTLMLYQHLGFVHCPIKEHCPAFPNCMDALIERILGNKAHRPSSWNHNTQWVLNSDNNQVNLVMLGIHGLAHELSAEIRNLCEDDECEIDCQLYTLDHRIIDGDVSLPDNSFQSSNFMPHGCFCVYSDSESFEYIRRSLEITLLSNLEQNDRLPFQGLPLVILFVGTTNQVEDAEILRLREEGQSLADSLQCPFIDVSLEAMTDNRRLSPQLVASALRQLIQSIRHRAGFLNSYQHAVVECSEPDIRIIMCVFCGDPYSLENVVGPLLNHQCCFLSGDRSIILETFLGTSKRKVEVIISSYHGANAFREELVHGFILVYSAKRKASLATLNAFSMNISHLPIQIMAVTDSGGASAFFSNDVSHQLITEGNATADRLQAHFMTHSSSFQQKTAFYTPFFKEVWDKKPEIERAFHLEDPSNPPLPPRHESYRLKMNSDQGSCGDLYFEEGNDFSPAYSQERLISGSEDSDTCSPLDVYASAQENSRNNTSTLQSNNKLHGLQVYPPPTTPPEPAPPDHFGHLANNSGLNLGSNTSLDEITSDVSGSRESLATHDSGWVDDAGLMQEGGVWTNNFSQHAFTTGRRHASKSSRFKGNSHTMKQPGKLNMKDFTLVTDAIARMNVNKEHPPRPSRFSKLGQAPLATPETVELGADYSQVKDSLAGICYDGEYSYSHVQDMISGTNKLKLRQRREKGRQPYSDSDSDRSSPESRHRLCPGDSKTNRKSTMHKRTRKKRTAIPVATPKVPPFSAPPTNGPGPMDFAFPAQHSFSYPKENSVESHEKAKHRLERIYGAIHDEDSSLDPSSPRDLNSPLFGIGGKQKDGDKTLRRKEKQKAKEEKELEKRRIKEEKLKKLAEERETKKKQKTKLKSGSGSLTMQPSLEHFVQSENNAVPVILEKCVRFIEEEGLDSEGIYRVPGNRAHVELLFHKFEEDSNVDINTLDIPVNAVATALKDFFSKRLPPLFPEDTMVELEDLSIKADRSCRLLALRGLLKKLPTVNFEILKFVFHHFVRISENCKLNSMDSKNLAICWWPTLLPIEFSDMARFEQMRPHLEDIVQTMIDQYPFLFCGKEAFVMV